jgi:hypothetical protein
MKNYLMLKYNIIQVNILIFMKLEKNLLLINAEHFMVKIYLKIIFTHYTEKSLRKYQPDFIEKFIILQY